MNNYQAFKFYSDNKSAGISALTRDFIVKFNVEESQFDQIRRKFSSLSKQREIYRKNSNLEDWREMSFCPGSHETRLEAEDDGITLYAPTNNTKHLLDCTTKHQRSRMSELISNVKQFSERENMTPQTVSALLLQFFANDHKNTSVSEVCKEIVETGRFGNAATKIETQKCSFLLDFLALGRRKYTELRRFLKSEKIVLTSYGKLSLFRSKVNLVNEIRFIEKIPNCPVGVMVNYGDIVTQTVSQLLEHEYQLQANFPLTVAITDGMDGSGCHRVYNQVQGFLDISTKTYILFGFKILWIQDVEQKKIWINPSPNSPFSLRPIVLVALQENRENVKFIMDTCINQQTTALIQNGISFPNGTVNILHHRSLFDTKMAALLDGAGGAVCHLCTATMSQINDKEFIRQGYPINRSIELAKQLFEEVDEEEFFSRTSNERFNITHHPTSDRDILPASPLHGYIRIFSWFMNLIYHLQSGEIQVWSPTSVKVENARNFVRDFLSEKTGIKIDFPNSHGGTSTTGNVARECFKQKANDAKDFLKWAITMVPHENREALDKIHTNLGVTLRLFNCDQKIDTEQFSTFCTDTYEFIVHSFPWASITPTLHKVLAHAPQLITRYNDGHGMKSFSEEGLEACNKYIRRYREQLARKTSFEDNIRDTFVRLLCQSNYLSLLQRKRLDKCKSKCHKYGSIQDELFLSFLVD